MNVAGFEEALASSLLIEIETGLTAHVALVAGLTLLKLAAWADGGLESNKGAADLYRLPTSYADAGNTDRLYEQELALLEAVDFDMIGTSIYAEAPPFVERALSGFGRGLLRDNGDLALAERIP